MAAKKGYNREPMLTDEHRRKIANSNVLTYLIEHIQGKREMGSTQVTAAIALMKKVLPDLASVEHSGETVTSFVMYLPSPAESVEEWEQETSKPAH